MHPWEYQLERDLDWREGELASLKILIAESTEGSTRQQALLRALWAMLYAHYEGFCKFAWDTYLDHLQGAGVLRSECVEPLARFSLAKSVKELRGDLSLQSVWDYCTSRFGALMGGALAFDVRLETDCNLWPDLCRANSASVSLPYAAVERHHARLRALVSRRNDIAHGQRMTVRSLDEYQEYEDAVFEVMYEIALGIVDCLSNRAYLRAVPP